MDSRASLRRGWARARLLFHTLHDLGLRTVGQVVSHSVRRRRDTAAEWAARAPRGPVVEPGQLRDVKAQPAGAVLRFAEAELEVSWCADDVVRLTWGPGPAPHPYAATAPHDWSPPAVSVEQLAGGTTELVGGRLSVRVAPDGTVDIASSDGQLLRRELPPRRRDHSWEHRFVARAGERLSGLGEQAGSVDLRGDNYRLWNRDPGGAWGPGKKALYFGAPVLVGSHPGGQVLSFYDNPESTDVRLAGHDDSMEECSLAFAGGQLRHYVMHGELSALLERFSALTGRPALPPRWALGYHQSRWGYRKDAHVRAVLDGYGAMGIPLSAVHLDIDYMDRYRVFTVDRHRFPDLAALSAKAMDQGVRVVTIVDPAVKEDPYPLYRQGVEGNRFCVGPDGEVQIGVVWPGRAAFPDFTDPGTRQWWATQYATLTDAGVSGIWHDMNEPTSISLVGDPTLPLGTRHDLEGRGGDHAQAHNVYGLLMNEAGHRGLRQARPGQRPFIVSRSGWVGNQRWAWNWTGDVETSWDGLRQQVATAVGLGLSGIPFVGSDTGGFTGIPDAELYLRWLQMSVHVPFCRTHSVVGVPPREPWRFPEPARSHVAAWIRFRYRLLPYLYTLAHAAAATGAPLVRPRWWADAAGPAAAGADDDTFLLGDDVFVAPVIVAGASERAVALPAGAWHEWWAASDPAAYTGAVRVGSPVHRIPVFARAGSVVPLDDGWADPAGPCALAGDGGLTVRAGPLRADHAPRLLSFHCWPAGGRATGVCVDDAGDGDGPVRRDVLELEGALPGDTARLRWVRSGDYPPPDRVRVVLHGLQAASASADGVAVESQGSSVECGVFDELELAGLRPA